MATSRVCGRQLAEHHLAGHHLAGHHGIFSAQLWLVQWEGQSASSLMLCQFQVGRCHSPT